MPLTQATNRVVIEGILNECDLSESSYFKNGEMVECIKGTVYVKTVETFDGKEKELIIPVAVFANKYKKNTTVLSPSYVSLHTAMTEYTSAAAAPDGVEPDYVRVTGGKIEMNEYPSKKTGDIVSFPRISASFISRVKKEEYKPEATFTVDFLIVKADYELDKEGEETGRYFIQGTVPKWDGEVELVPFYINNKNVIDAVTSYWQVGDTVTAIGKLDFSQTVEKKSIKSNTDFGEERVRDYVSTIRVSDIIITGGNQTPHEGADAFDGDEIQQALTRRRARLEEAKTRAKTPTAPKTKAPEYEF